VWLPEGEAPRDQVDTAAAAFPSVLSERDICTKFITPALRKAGWDETLQIREEVSFTKGRIIVRGKLVSRGQAANGSD
jgi:type I site-specific restriction endonuclease